MSDVETENDENGPLDPVPRGGTDLEGRGENLQQNAGAGNREGGFWGLIPIDPAKAFGFVPKNCPETHPETPECINSQELNSLIKLQDISKLQPPWNNVNQDFFNVQSREVVNLNANARHQVYSSIQNHTEDCNLLRDAVQTAVMYSTLPEDALKYTLYWLALANDYVQQLVEMLAYIKAAAFVLDHTPTWPKHNMLKDLGNAIIKTLYYLKIAHALRLGEPDRSHFGEYNTFTKKRAEDILNTKELEAQSVAELQENLKASAREYVSEFATLKNPTQSQLSRFSYLNIFIFDNAEIKDGQEDSAASQERESVVEIPQNRGPVTSTPFGNGGGRRQNFSSTSVINPRTDQQPLTGSNGHPLGTGGRHPNTGGGPTNQAGNGHQSSSHRNPQRDQSGDQSSDFFGFNTYRQGHQGDSHPNTGGGPKHRASNGHQGSGHRSSPGSRPRDQASGFHGSNTYDQGQRRGNLYNQNQSRWDWNGQTQGQRRPHNNQHFSMPRSSTNQDREEHDDYFRSGQGSQWNSYSRGTSARGGRSQGATFYDQQNRSESWQDVFGNKTYMHSFQKLERGVSRTQLFDTLFNYRGNRMHIDPQTKAEFYLALPAPFNTLPSRPKEKNNVEYLKAIRHDSTLLFKGTAESFMVWSASFFSGVHVLRGLSEIEKLHCLRASMDPECDQTHEFEVIFNRDSTEMAYFEALADILKRFGDPRDLLATFQTKLQSYSLNTNSHYSVNVFYRMLQNYVKIQDELGAETSLGDDTSFLSNLMQCFEDETHVMNYIKLCQDNFQRVGLSTFIIYIQMLRDNLTSRDKLLSYRVGKKNFKPFGRKYSSANVTTESQTQESLPAEVSEPEQDWHTSKDTANVLKDQRKVSFQRDKSPGRDKSPSKNDRKCDVSKCTGSHPLWKCSIFPTLSDKDKNDIVVKAMRCFRCLGYGHYLADCKSEYGGCKSCKDSKHHTLMCKIRPFVSAFYTADYLPYFDHESFVSKDYAYALDIPRLDVSLRIICAKFKNPKSGTTCQLNVLLDDGCSSQYISERASERLGLEGPGIELFLSTVDAASKRVKSIVVAVELASMAGDFRTELSLVVLKDLVKDLRPVDWSEQKKKFEHLKDLPFPPLSRDFPDGVDVIIGVRRPELSRCLQEVAGEEGQPIARKTRLGYTCVGPLDQHNNDEIGQVLCFYKVTDSLIQEKGVFLSNKDDLFTYKEGKLVATTDSVLSCASNSKHFMDQIPEDQRVPVKDISPVLADETDKDGKPLPSAKILGMKIDFEKDTVGYKVKEKLSDTGGVSTNRRCASIVASVYDPLGRIMPCIIMGRILMQLILIILFTHERIFEHMGGPGQTVNDLALKYACVGMRDLVSREIRLCVRCQDINARPLVQKMAPLPLERLPTDPSGNYVFEATGLDYIGPFEVKMGRGMSRAKRWVILFTCLHFRAVRLEIFQDYSTEWTIKAIQNFLSRNARPKIFISDQGTQLVSTAKKLAGSQEEKDTLTESFPEIQWRFLPVATPHMGGCYERLVGLTKKSLLAVKPDMQFTDLEMVHFFTKIEGGLNNRPLSYVSGNPNEIRPLTPNDFLAGKCIENVEIPEGLPLHKSFQHVQKVLAMFWRRYLKELVPQLRSLQKWQKEMENLQPGDIVMILDSTSERGTWPLGRIVEVIESQDSLVRKVVVHVAGKEKLMSLKHLCPVKLREDAEQQYI